MFSAARNEVAGPEIHDAAEVLPLASPTWVGRAKVALISSVLNVSCEFVCHKILSDCFSVQNARGDNDGDSV
jgi:hypothetical protein